MKFKTGKCLVLLRHCLRVLSLEEKNQSCMFLHAVSVCDKVYNEALEKNAPQKAPLNASKSENRQVGRDTMFSFPP